MTFTLINGQSRGRAGLKFIINTFLQRSGAITICIAKAFRLGGCDLVKMKVVDVMASGQIKERASVEKWMEEELMV